MAYKNQIVQIELFDQLGEIIGILVHIVAVPGLVRLTMAAPVVSDDPIAVPAEEQHLRIPGVAGKRPAMGKEDRLSLAPILVGDLGSVFGGDGTHGPGSLCLDSTFGLAGGAAGRKGCQRNGSRTGGKRRPPGNRIPGFASMLWIGAHDVLRA